MNAKIIITILIAILTANIAHPRNQQQPDSLSRQLQEVVVTAKQPATRLVGSTLVTTIPGSNLAGLGTALDVLAQLPMMKVQDDDVSVTGKNNLEIYIDGRPLRDRFELRQLLSSDIKKVELLMAPGAAYGSAVGAVLRITTRRNFIKGLSVNEQLQVEKQRKWSAMDYLSLSYREGSWEWYLDGAINRNNMTVKGSTTNTLDYQGKKTVIGGSQDNSNPTLTGMARAGFNYARGAHSFGAYYRLNPEKGDFTNNGTEWLDNDPALRRIIDRRIRAHSHFVSTYYETTFADTYRLHFDGDFKSSDADNRTATAYPDAIADNVHSADRRKSSLWAGKLYMEFPLAGGNFTAGTQDSYTRTRLDYRMMNDRVEEYIPSSATDARQTSAALFASWGRTFGKFSLSAGVRYEYIDYDFRVDGKRDENVSRRDNLLTPDFSLGYSFGENAQLSLSYRMATVRPPYSSLTGSLNYVGRHEIEGGNPALRDEKNHNLQLFGMWNGFMIQTNFSRSLDTYAFVKQLYHASDLQLLMHPVNIDVTALSCYLVWSKSIGVWSPNVTAGMYRQWLAIERNRYDRPIFSYYFNNTFSLSRGWSITANISGSSRGDMHTNRFGSNPFTMDASVGKTFLGKSLTVKLSVSDIFNTANNSWTMNTFGVFVDKRQDYDQRGISLNVIYNFQQRKSRYKGRSAAEDEMKRL